MNLHNGEYCTLYKQAGGGKFFTTLIKILYRLGSWAFVLFPLIALFSGPGFLKGLLSLVAAVAGFFTAIVYATTSKYAFQKMWSKRGGAVKKFISWVVAFVIFLVISLIFKA